MFLNIQGDYKLCERLHKFIVKKVTSTHKLKERHCSCMRKKKSCSLQWCAFNFCVAITFLPI